jgi:hypothetical protein
VTPSLLEKPSVSGRHANRKHNMTEDEMAAQEATDRAVEAQDKQNHAIAIKSVGILKHIRALEGCGGQRNYRQTILEALRVIGSELPMAFIGEVCPDSALYAKARKALEDEGLIRIVQDKQRKILKLIEPKPAEPAPAKTA